MASIFALFDFTASPIAVAKNSSGKSVLAALQRLFQAHILRREKKARLVVVSYLAQHSGEDLIRWGYSTVEIQAFRREACAWLVPMI